jgi:hypothetical protein
MVEERTEEAHRLIEDIDNIMKKFNKQQMDFFEARVNLAEKELNSRFQEQFAKVKYSEKQAKLAIKKWKSYLKRFLATPISVNKLKRNSRELKSKPEAQLVLLKQRKIPGRSRDLQSQD